MAVVDDMGAILVIALFYSKKIQLSLILLAFLLLLIKKGVFILNSRLKMQKLPFSLLLILGFLIWLSFLGSGIHATLAGVLIGLLIPHTSPSSQRQGAKAFSPLKASLHALDPWVKFFIMPVFALFNAGVALGQDQNLIQLAQHPLFLGVSMGLFVGKPLGITGVCWLSVKCGIAQLPKKTSWSQLFGVSMLAGVGFTMSLFISHLALQGETGLEVFSKVGVLTGSLFSACLGLVALSLTIRKK